VPGVIAAADSLDAALSEAAEALAFAAEDWEQLTGAPFPRPRSLDALQADAEFAAIAEKGCWQSSRSLPMRAKPPEAPRAAPLHHPPSGASIL
jgi:predicted RNase H-like HicB family nuclease